MNRELSTVNRELSTVNRELSTVNRELSTVNRELSTVNRELSTVSREPTTVNRELSTVIREPTSVIRELLIFLLALLLSSTNSFAGTPVFFKTIPKQPLELFINTTNDIFLLQKGMIERYTSDGVFFQNYGSIYINERTDIISANGFKTMLFSPDYGKVIELDNRMREIDVIDVYQLGNYIISCIGTSYDNNYLWMWDASTQRLLKFDKDQKPVFVSNTLSMQIGKTINPREIIESGIYLYLVDRKEGIYIFDNQGNYIKNIPMEGVHNLTVIDGMLYYVKKEGVFSYDNLTFTETHYAGTPDLKYIHLGKTLLCGVNKDGFVDIWKF